LAQTKRNKVKELNLESGAFSLGEIACVFAGRLDLFVYSFVGGPKHNKHHHQDVNDSSAGLAIEREVSKCKAGGIAKARAVQGAAVVNYPACEERARTVAVTIANAAQG
jgi:hypothetical protein